MSAFLGSSFLAPAAFAFLGLIPVVIVLYLLKLRRTEVIIPSTMLWRKSLQDLTANAPFQRLRKNLLLLLQILALLALVFALARPFTTTEGARGRSLCLVIDRSASMQTVETGGTRLELAKQQSLKIIDSLESGDRMMVVSFAQSADVCCELTDDQYRLRQAVRGIEAEDTRSNIRDVMLIVRSLAPDDRERASVAPDIELLLMSDGKLSDLEQLGALSTNINYVKIGETNKNVAITGFSVRRGENTNEDGSQGRQCFLLIHNESDAPVETTVSLFFRGNLEEEAALLAIEELSLAAGQPQELIFQLPHLETGLLRAEIDFEDALALDNRAWLALRPEAYLDVLLVSETEAMGTYFLRRVLTLDPRANVSAITPAGYQDTNEYDLILFNGWAPETLPAGALVFFNALPPLPGLSSGGELRNPPVLATAKDHPLMRFLNPANLRIAKALDLSLPDGARELVTTQTGALIADVSRGGQQITLVAFDLGESDWPLHLSFPLFIQNLLAYTPGSGLSSEMAVRTGAPLKILPAEGVTHATITRPGGTADTLELDPLRPVFYSETTRSGPYRVARGDHLEIHAVNLLDRQESAITPAPKLDLGRAEIEAAKGPIRFNRELWPWCILAGLALLTAEWWVYSRRADLG